MSEILFIEAFYGGSHKQLIDLLCTLPDHVLFTLPDKKWHWRARTSALYFSQIIPLSKKYRVLFTSSVLNLAEFVALRPDLASLRKVLYFHENQLVYPIRKQQERDFQFGYNQILSCLVADEVIFNSTYNKESFLSNIHSFMKLIPDHRPKSLADIIRPKCRVINFPLCLSHQTISSSPSDAALDVDSGRQEAAETGCGVSVCSSDTLVGVDSGQLTTSAVVVDADSRISTSDAAVDVDSGWQEAAYCKLREHLSEETDYSEVGGDVCYTSYQCAGGVVDGKADISTSSDRSSHKCEERELSVEENASINSDGSSTNLQITVVTDDVESLTTISTPVATKFKDSQKKDPVLHIVWAHRWEHDKDPDTFFNVLYRLQNEGHHFNVSVLGECFTQVPDVFLEAQNRLSAHILNWGYLRDKHNYYAALHSADVSVSTAQHEFFGVAMLESVSLGCYPLCPHRLVYPEIFPDECLYRTTNQLFKRLRAFCEKPHLLKRTSPLINFEKFSWKNLKKKYKELLYTDN